MWTSKNRARYDRSKLRYPSEPRLRACEGNGLVPASSSQPDMAQTSGRFQAERDAPAHSSTHYLVCCPLTAPQGRTDQAVLVRNRCAAIRLLASACHNATAWALIRPRTGMKPNP
jgi:hypothetical protein